MRVLFCVVFGAPLLVAAAAPAVAQWRMTQAPVVSVPVVAPPASAVIPGATVAPVGVAPAQPPTPAALALPPQPASAAPVPAAPPPAAAASPAPTPPIKTAKVKPRPVPAAPRETALSDDPQPAFAPETFFVTQKAVDRYAAIVAAGGWPAVAPAAASGKGPAVVALRQRLAAEGDLDAQAAGSDVWGPDLVEALRRFQIRHGLKRTGALGPATLKAMNVPAEKRLAQLTASAQRIAGYGGFPFGERYVAVNLPSAAVEAVEGGRVARRYVAVVGDVKHPSPEVEAKIGAVNLNPTWTVPTSIIKNEIIPKMRKDRAYLSRQRIRMLDQTGAVVDPGTIDWSTNRAVNYTLRQDSGAGNALGTIRLAMPNRHSVYMHDTPTKKTFGQDYRFASHGCVRVQGVDDLAQWLLEGVNGGAWTAAAIDAKIVLGTRDDIRLPQPVPVIWTYLTGWATADGAAHFRDDVYGLDDRALAVADRAATASIR